MEQTLTTEVRLAVMEEQLRQNERDHKDLKGDLSEIKLALQTFIAVADAKYASKQTEKDLNRLKWYIITTAVGGMVGIGFLIVSGHISL